ncbi:hypothetical protein [Sphingobium boeckii]|uniref:Uncharacterized protein n=1 Tax=Sphingobium boeckii TaxID=1082345 RepID=A0A7W9EHI9_9SPHN|nr:hypothetical protein [Sphingobium boeckii]MBB5687831.1 hypothetical protein [Sphingobium boeckii]
MDEFQVTNALVGVLKKIQAIAGQPCPPLDGGSVPPDLLPKFDSTVWPAAATMVARVLKVTIPNDVHIFGGEKGRPLLTINQTVALIIKKATPKKTEEKVAA